MYKHLIPPDSKHKSYRGRYRVGDNPRIHEVTLRTNVKEVAEKLLNDIYKDAQREAVGLIPASFTRNAQRRPVAEVIEEFLNNVRKRSRSSDYVRVLKIRLGILSKGCGWKAVGDITKQSFLTWRDEQTDYQAKTLNHFFDAARVFSNWLEQVFEIPNPLKRIQKLPVPVKFTEGPRAFTEDELRRLFATVKPERRLQYRILAFTGLRGKELRRLCWGDVHLDGKPGLQLRPEATKAGRGDWIPLLSVIVPELREARPEGWRANMLVMRRGVSDLETLHRDLEHAGIPIADHLGRRAGFHTFRRTLITHLQKRGVDRRVIMQIARHKSLRLTDWTYTDATQLPLTEGMETLAELASPSPAPRKIGQNRVSVSKAVSNEKSIFENDATKVVGSEDDCHALAGPVQRCPEFELVPGEGVEPTCL